MKTKIFYGLLILTGLGIALAYFSQSRLNAIPPNKKTNFGKYPKLSSATIAYNHAGWEFLRTRDPITNKLPVGIKAKELKYASGLPVRNNYLRMSGEQMAPEQYRSQTWKSLGPENVSGRILSIELDINDEDIILAGSASGGLWRSTDAGNTWTKTTAPNAVQSVTCIEQDIREGKTATWYYGTGELTSTTDRQFSIYPRTVGFGNGIYKSTDNGASWTLLPSTSGGVTGDLTEAFQGVWNIVVDPNNLDSDIVYVAAYGGILRSDNGGETWTHVLGDVITKSFCTDVVISPNGMLYAALSTFSTNESGIMPIVYGIWESSDGINWTSITPADFPAKFRTVKLDIPESNPNALYIFTENPIPDPDPTFSFTASEHMLWKVTDLNTEEPVWTNVTDNLPGKGKGNLLPSANDPLHGYNSIGGYAMKIKAHPDNEDVLFLGGTNCYRNTKGFADSTFTKLLGGYPYDGSHENLHPDIHCFTVSPSNHDVMFISTDGGIYKTMNCLADSVKWNYISDTLVTTQFYWVGIDHAAQADDFVIGGCQDNAIYYHDLYFPSLKWKTVMGGDGMTCMLADQKTFAIVSVYNGYIFSLTFDEDMNIENDFFQTPDMADPGDFNFFTNFVIDPVSNKLFYMAAKNRILRKDDMHAAAYDSTLYNDGWQWLDNTGLIGGEFITALNISKEPANILYYGSSYGKFFRMDNVNTGNPVATELTSPLFPPDGYVGFVEVDKSDANNVFVVFSNYNVQSIFHSVDGGETWVNVSGNLEEYPDGSGGGPSVRCIRILHYDDGTAYFVATSVGLFSTTELKGDETVWLQEGNDVIGNIVVDNIDVRNTDGWIVIATQGNGIYSTNFDSSLSVNNTPDKQSIELRNYPNPFHNQTTIEYTLTKSGNVNLSLMDVNGRFVKQLFAGQQAEGVHACHLEATDLSTGIYFVNLETNNTSQSLKIVINK